MKLNDFLCEGEIMKLNDFSLGARAHAVANQPVVIQLQLSDGEWYDFELCGLFYSTSIDIKSMSVSADLLLKSLPHAIDLMELPVRPHSALTIFVERHREKTNAAR